MLLVAEGMEAGGAAVVAVSAKPKAPQASSSAATFQLLVTVLPMTSGSYTPSPLRDGHV
jgi:hypothetical protein